MSRKMIPVEESLARWRKVPQYVKACGALEDEFALTKAMIEARAHAGLTQEQLAGRMHMTQAANTRLESGVWRAAADFVRAVAGALMMRLTGNSGRPVPAPDRGQGTITDG